ncbi:MAG: hypothetical protein ACEPOW_07780 [Bacteroidales bacterium]
MKNPTKTTGIILWIIAFLLTIGIASYQRMTGPTHPEYGDVKAFGGNIEYKFLRSWDVGSGAPVVVSVPDKDVQGFLRFRRYKSHDEWMEIPMNYHNGKLVAELPAQPPAGKVMYNVTLTLGHKKLVLCDAPLILRYKGAVPAYILVPHIIFMFLALMFGIRVGLEIIFKRLNTLQISSYTLIFLVLGGLILGPIVQKYAFDAYWTGWPWGHDLTDNKTLAGVIFWFIAWIKLRKNPNNRLWPAIALLVFLTIYLIPHSAFGSEIDYTQAG